MSQAWQHPYVNLFKHYGAGEWTKCSKEGDVTKIMDRSVKSSIYRISGAIPSANYIQFPKTKTPPLELNGQYIYILFKPITGKFFSIHMDIVTVDDLVIRISLSNIFKEFKLTSTWLQFPVVSNPPYGSVEEATTNAIEIKNRLGIKPGGVTRWTLLCMDMQYVLSVYLNKQFSHLKSIRLCATMFVRNVFTSYTCYEPGLDIRKARKTGLLASGVVPLPREMSFPLDKHEEWHLKYDYIKFPKADSAPKFRNVIPGCAGSADEIAKVRKESLKKSSLEQKKNHNSRIVLSEKVTSSLSNVRKTIKPKQFQNLPEIGLAEPVKDTNSIEVHSFMKKPNVIRTERLKSRLTEDSKCSLRDQMKCSEDKENSKSRDKENRPVRTSSRVASASRVEKSPSEKKRKDVKKHLLHHDPIIKLRQIVGFGGGNYSDVFWTKDGETVIYPSHACVILFNVNSCSQQFLLGHTDKITAVCVNEDVGIMSSAQAGPNSVVRIWKTNIRKCLSIFQCNLQDVSMLSFSKNGGRMCCVGEDINGKQVLSVWDTSHVLRGGSPELIAKAHTEMSVNTITRVQFIPFDDSRLLTCGNNNIRLWRIRTKHLKSCPVDLGQFCRVHFTDFAFECTENRLLDDLSNIKIFFTATNGNLYEVKYKTLRITNVHALLPVGNRKNVKEEEADVLCALQCISVSDNFCAVGSEDGYLRLWPLSFKSVYLEAEYEGCVKTVAVSPDGTKVVGGTSIGNLGVLNIVEKSYSTITRSHTSEIYSFSFENIHKQVATVSSDRSIKIWDGESFGQVYDFQSATESPTCVSCHSRLPDIACGFRGGSVRVFTLTTTSLKYDLHEHLDTIHAVKYNPNGDLLYSTGADGSLVMYDVTNAYDVLRTIPDSVVKDCQLPNHVMATDDKGHRIAVIASSRYVITIFSASSLDELLHIDVTSTCNHQKKYMMDEPLALCFAPSFIGHLLVVTSLCRLLKFDARSGQILSEISNVHKESITSLSCSPKGKYIATAGDRIIKVWDYAMEECQSFIGHSSVIHQLEFSEDCDQILSCGEALFIWDFLPFPKKNSTREQRSKESLPTRNGKSLATSIVLETSSIIPRSSQPPPPQKLDNPPHHLHPIPISDDQESSNDETECEEKPPKSICNVKRDLQYDNVLGANKKNFEDEGIIDKYKQSTEWNLNGEEKYDSVTRDLNESIKCMRVVNNSSHDATSDSDDADFEIERYGPRPLDVKNVNSVDVSAIIPGEFAPMTSSSHAPPKVVSHFRSRQKTSELATKHYAPPVNQAGMALYGAIGCNPNSLQNIAWHPETGLFLYTIGCQLVHEDLSNGKQRLFHNPVEEISTIALQHDSKVVAVGGSLNETSHFGAIVIWDLPNGRLHKVLEHHNSSIVSLTYSRDDRFLISVGDYRECSLVVWSTHEYTVLTQATTEFPLHCVRWHPYCANEFTSVGRNNSVYFWHLVNDDKPSEATLNVVKGDVPKEVWKGNDENNDVTAISYAGKNMLLIGTAKGVVCVWSISEKRCIMHWQADKSEIVTLSSSCGKIVTCAASKTIKLWKLPSVEVILTATQSDSESTAVILEVEKDLDGTIISAVFDDVMEMGIVGTNNGTIWYVNWTEENNEFVRIISGHHDKINDLTVCAGSGQYFATACADGCLKLWNLETREQTAQFLVMRQECLCVSFCFEYQERRQQEIPLDYNQVIHPLKRHEQQPSQCLAGYGDGTVRLFDFGQMKMLLKMKPHSTGVTAISSSPDGRVAISGDREGVIVISSMNTGLTVRVLNDHKGGVLSKISFQQTSSPLGSSLWLVSSNDCRISIWKSDWSKDICELYDWLTFACVQNVKGVKGPDVPCLAEFSPSNPDVVLYTGFGFQKEINLYSCSAKKVVKTISIQNWVLSFHTSPTSNLMVLGCQDRLLKLVDCESGTFQDFIGHYDAVNNVTFCDDGKKLITTAHSEILLWDIMV